MIINGSAGPKCYQPAQIQAACGLTPLLNTGAGRTIVIVDAFQSPYVQSDLSIFNSTFGLPKASFQQIAPFGLTPFDPNDPNMDSWAEEITLDVLWAHAMAPRAKILPALARSNDDADILNTTKYVVDHDLGDVISQSFGEAEACMDRALLAQQHQVSRTPRGRASRCSRRRVTAARRSSTAPAPGRSSRRVRLRPIRWSPV